MITYASDGHSAVLSDMNNTESLRPFFCWGRGKCLARGGASFARRDRRVKHPAHPPVAFS